MHPEPSIRRSTIEIKMTSYPFANLILATDPPINDSRLMMSLWTHGPMVWTQSTALWTYSTNFSIEK
jgi:hypothetical protein